jgi:alpha-tubulin suppressor-like RCC1 family protein
VPSGRALARGLWGLGAVLGAALGGCESIAGIRDLSPRGIDASADVVSIPISDAAVLPDVPTIPLPDGGPIITTPDGGTISAVLPRRLALGSTHSCALGTDGRVFCWGSGASGQLGTGTSGSRAEGKPVPGLKNIVSVVAGTAHSCALDTTGRVYCWGRSDQGQLGGSPAAVGAPVAVDLQGARAMQIAAGSIHSCALRVGGKVRCWGGNGFGQLGNGTTDGGSAVVEPTSLDSVTALFGGGFFTCALKGEDAPFCWGDNGFGQLGDRTKTTRPTPVNVRDVAFATRDMSLGTYTSCAVASTGALFCWGRNRAIGDPAPQGIVVPMAGSAAEFTSPAAVGADAGAPLVVGIATGAAHACARTLSDHAVCWGSNLRAQLAVDSDGGAVAGFNDVSALAGAVREVAVGLGHSCALAGADIFCWGNNDLAQAGAAAGAPRPKPGVVTLSP